MKEYGVARITKDEGSMWIMCQPSLEAVDSIVESINGRDDLNFYGKAVVREVSEWEEV